jgi:hypothetical protein
MDADRRKFLKASSLGIAHVLLTANTRIFADKPTTTSSSDSNSEFNSAFDEVNDRFWIGPEFWSNPMENWQIANGRLECRRSKPNCNVHILTRQLAPEGGDFQTSVRIGIIQQGKTYDVGFRIGIHDDIDDWRGNLLWGEGIDAGISTDNKLVIGEKTLTVEKLDLTDITLKFLARDKKEKYDLTLIASDTKTGREFGRVSDEVAAEKLVGNIALVNNFRRENKSGSKCWFDNWNMSGSKLSVHPERTFGPILWSMHTVSNSRSSDDYVMKITAIMPPVSEADDQNVVLQIMQNGAWRTIGKEKMHPDSRTATFRIANWNSTIDVPYRLAYKMRYKNAPTKDFYQQGTIRAEPKGRPLELAAMTCQYHYGFPYTPIVEKLKKLNPDMMYFSGDQIYEANGHFGIVRAPADRSIINYLRKFYLFGWSFGDLMRDRPTLCIPDDHDVYQGNVWGNGGNFVRMERHQAGGYAQPAQMLNVVHLTNCSHHPDFYDTTPIEQNISVYYGDMVYARTSFAIVADRMFKSGPRDTVAIWPGRPDHVVDENYDVKKLDKPGLVLLGERQHKFLEHWATDWRQADMKVVLSQTPLSSVATHHGTRDNYLKADLDSNGWPQTPRNAALKIMRKGFALHVNGDQHISSLVHQGVDEQRDSCWSFCTPAITVGYQRWWRADEMGIPFENRPDHNLPDTGEYIDCLGNKVYVYAIANPTGSKDENRYRMAQIKASGFGMVRIDPVNRTYRCRAYRFAYDDMEDKFAGFDLTIGQNENYNRKPIGYLENYSCPGVDRPVVKVFDQNNELVYAIRAKKQSFRPWVFDKGRHTVVIGDADKNLWKTYTDQMV